MKLTLTMGEWAVFQGILQTEGIRFMPVNERFASLYPGMGVGAFQLELLVDPEDFDHAKSLFEEFLKHDE